MRLDQFDLNLLVAFNALLEERSVTAAAQRLNVTQPAMSAALKRLREALQDDILVQQGKKMFPTQHALALAPQVDLALVNLRSLISSGTAFDPKTSKREFKIITSDYITTVLLVPLISALQAEAPEVRLSLALPTGEGADRLARGEADLMISPEEFLEGDNPREQVFLEHFVVVGCETNRALETAISREDFLKCGHVSVKISGRDTYIENALAKVAPHRRIELTAQSFIQVPWLLRNTDRLAVMHERLARVCAKPLALKISPVPFDIPPMLDLMMHHSTRSRDAGLAWLRRRIIEVAQQS